MVPGGPLGGGFVLDGFPRTLHQARELDRVIAGRPAASRHRSRRAARDRVRPDRGPAGLRELPAGVPRQPAADARLGVRHVRRQRAPARRRHRGSGRTPARAVRTRDRPDRRVLPGARSADASSTGSARATRCSSGSSRSASSSSPSGAPPWSCARRATQIALMRRAGAVVAEMHEACTRGGGARRDDRRSRPRRARRARPPPRPLQLPRLPRLPGGRVHLAERGDRARHPRARGCWRPATSSRSTAGRSSRAGTPTPRSRCRVGEVDAESQRLMDVTRAALESAIARDRGRQPPGRHRRRGRARR